MIIQLTNRQQKKWPLAFSKGIKALWVVFPAAACLNNLEAGDMVNSFNHDM